MENLHVKIEGDKDITLRQGKALELYYKNGIIVHGNITVPSVFVEIRHEEIDCKNSHLEVSRENMKIILIVNENDDKLISTMVGWLKLSEDIAEIGINTGKVYNSFELADFIKMHRSYFETKDVANNLVTRLRNFKAKVNKEIENFKDDKGNYSAKRSQVVESETPDNFIVNIPVFKGMKKRGIEVEVIVHPETLNFSLISPDLLDLIANEKDLIIDAEIEKITKLITIPVFEC